MISKFRNAVSNFFAYTLGLTWKSPPWIQKARNHPKAFLGGFLSVLALLVAATYTYNWYTHLPKPIVVIAKITEPNITPLEEELYPENLVINFGIENDNGDFLTKSVAPLNKIGKPVLTGITLIPEAEGEWTWETDSKLVFTPTYDWPAGQKYIVKFADTVFDAKVKMGSLQYDFTTKPFAATIANLEFYQDPIHQEQKQIIATINFNFSVDTHSLANHIQLQLQAIKNGKRDLNAEKIKFDLTYDKFKRTVYLKSENITLPEISRFVVLTVDKGIQSESETAKTQIEISKNLLIPDRANYFKINTAEAKIIRNAQDRPEQVLFMDFTVGATEAAVKKSMHAYLLPANYPATAVEKEKIDYEWANPGEVTPAILALAEPLKLDPIPTDRNYALLHGFKFKSKSPRYIYVKMDKGLQGFGNFTLDKPYAAVIKVPELPKEISFLHKGALLALGGEQKLSVLVRGLSAVKFEIARILPENINQLVTQTQGDFNNPYFINGSFNQYNISRIFSTIQSFDASDLTKQQYTAIDFAKYLGTSQNPNGPQGLFLLKATAWDVEKNSALDTNASRLVLVTDMGLIVKDNQDGSHDVFVQSITQGTPVANVAVSVLGKNGLPILLHVTDSQGRVNFPSLKDFTEEREPVAYIASLGSDVSFIPFNNYSRELNFTRFDIGGVYKSIDQPSVRAFVFSDRGIYRPGDTMHLGFILKSGFVQPQPAGLPIEIQILDPRGNTVMNQKVSVDATGLFSLDFPTQSTFLTGQYVINAFIVKDNNADSLLGSTTVKVNEFLPDRMRINTQFSQSSKAWLSPVDLKATVELWNLYGTPATERTVSAKIQLSPQEIYFDKFADYNFVDPLIDPNKPAKIFNYTLTDLITDEKGKAIFDLNLGSFNNSTYQLIFFAEGFEAGGGRSVATQSKALISPLPHLVGYKADGDLKFIKQNSVRAVNLIAIDPTLEPIDLNDTKVQLFSLHPVTTLVKKPEGTYEYQSIMQSELLDTKPLVITKDGINYSLPTDKIGDFSVVIVDKNNTELTKFGFSVVGESQQPLAKNAELQVKLDKESYTAGESINLQITAPYTGAGLITIERDKVYSVQWFKTESTNSMQSIQIPADLQGDAYVNVTFVRDWNSPDIFISPLSYSIVPFKLSHENHAIQIDLSIPEQVKPGETLSVEYKTNVPGKIIIFAVDEGILQVTKFTTPNPLAFFFEKHALQVITQQTVDLILPKFLQERESSSVGGDDGEDQLSHHLNPFKRKTDLPVVFWSGIVDADTTPRTLSYAIPNYFNGSLKVMAVAVASEAVGSAEKSTRIRGDFIINPNVPTFVTPGDRFEITAGIANNVKDSGDLPVNIQLKFTDDLELVGEVEKLITIPEGREKTFKAILKAKQLSDEAKVTIIATSGTKAGAMDTYLSIRPASAFSTTVVSGSDKGAQKTLPISQNFYPQFHKIEAALSTNPLILVAGLNRYLENFPYGCTEQMTSQAWPLLAMSNQSWFVEDAQTLNDRINKVIRLLGLRQMSSGALSYWPGLGENESNTFSTIYAMHFLTEAKMHGFNIPLELIDGGISYLKTFVSDNPKDTETARLQAYAIYVLTLNQIVTTNYLTNLQVYLEQDKEAAWEQDIMSAYIAATYQLLHNDNEADRLIKLYRSESNKEDPNDFHNQSLSDAQYLYLLAKHFPTRLNTSGESLVTSLVKAINTDEINTVLSGFASIALSAYNTASDITLAVPPSMVGIYADKQEKKLTSTLNNFEKIQITDNFQSLRFENPSKQRYFYQFIQSGFEKTLPTQPIQQGLEISREYRDDEGNVIQTIGLGDEIQVHIQFRSSDDNDINNIAIVDLLPGGFEVVRDSVKSDNVDYVDVREDRVIFFTSASPKAVELVYSIKATNTGEFTVPPILAESMYNPAVKAESSAGKIAIQIQDK